MTSRGQLRSCPYPKISLWQLLVRSGYATLWSSSPSTTLWPRSTALLVSLVSSSYTGFGTTEKHIRKQTNLLPSQHERVSAPKHGPVFSVSRCIYFFFESHRVPTDLSYIYHNKDVPMPMPHPAACTTRENKLSVLSTSARSCATRGVSIVMNFVRSISRITRAFLVVIALPTTTK